MNDLVSYCFGYREKDIVKDYANNGRSLIMERIMKEKKTGGCDCGKKNPKGR